jgi:hypothetical protein
LAQVLKLFSGYGRDPPASGEGKMGRVNQAGSSTGVPLRAKNPKMKKKPLTIEEQR